MNAIAYVVAVGSLVAAILALLGVIGIELREREQRRLAQRRLRNFHTLVSEEALEGPIEKKAVGSTEVEAIANALEEAAKSFDEVKPIDEQWQTTAIVENAQGQRERGELDEHDRYLMLRDILLGLLDDLPLEAVLLDPEARREVEAALEKLSIEPVRQAM